MAKYTIELRNILGFYNKYVDDKSTFSVDDTINNAMSNIFTSSNIYNDIDRTIQKFILKQYYLNEIGFDTPAEFIIRITNYYDINRIRYQMIYDKMVKLSDIDTSGTVKRTGTSTDTSTDKGTSKDKETSASTNRYSDTPQGGLDGVLADRYLTNVNVLNDDNTKENEYNKDFSNDNKYEEIKTDTSASIDNILKIFNANVDILADIVSEYKRFFMFLLD